MPVPSKEKRKTSMRQSSDPRKAIDKAMKNMKSVVSDKEQKLQALSEEIVKNVKTEEPKAAAKVENVINEVKKTTKTAVNKAVAVKVDFQTEISIQHEGKECDMKDVSDRVKAAFVSTGHELTEIKSLKIYIKPEDNAAYYVVNDEMDGRVVLFF